MRKDIMISGICALSLIMLTQNAYAQTYEKESESGKVVTNTVYPTRHLK